MKKFLKLTTNEAIRHFTLRDNTLAPEKSAEIKAKLDELEKHIGELSVSITIPTHHTKPDYEIDKIELRKAIAEVEKQLYGITDKRKVWAITENLTEAEASVDFSLNLDSLVVYANEHFSSVVKLPVPLVRDIVIGRSFDLRPLYRTRQQNRHYYIITVSKQRIRLLEAFNDKVVDEITTGDFPFEKTEAYRVKQTRAGYEPFEENMEKEFYNDADKSFRTIWNETSLPVVLAGDVKSVSYYLEQMDDSRMVIARVPGNFDNAPLYSIIKAVTPEMEKLRATQQKEHSDAIDTAMSGGLLKTYPGYIFEAILNGQANTLYLGEHYSLDGKITREDIDRLEQANGDLRLNDLLHIIIRDVRNQGGQIVFVDDVLLEPYGGIALTLRYTLGEDGISQPEAYAREAAARGDVGSTI